MAPLGRAAMEPRVRTDPAPRPRPRAKPSSDYRRGPGLRSGLPTNVHDKARHSIESKDISRVTVVSPATLLESSAWRSAGPLNVDSGRIGRRVCANSGHVWTYMDPARLQAGLANSGPRVTTADVYPASLCGLNDRRRRREPRWIFARFHLNGAKALAEAMPVQTPGSGSDGVTVSPSSANRCNC
jgi:hypothetical protein